jgi:hypothetical protein
MAIQVGLSPGELLDRISILELKAQHLPEPVRSVVRRDLALALAARDRELPESECLSQLSAELDAVNLLLWQLEDRLRGCEREQRFDGEFVALARSVYKNNDRRAALKRCIDAAVNSDSTEYKSHALPEP